MSNSPTIPVTMSNWVLLRLVCGLVALLATTIFMRAGNVDLYSLARVLPRWNSSKNIWIVRVAIVKLDALLKIAATKWIAEPSISSIKVAICSRDGNNSVAMVVQNCEIGHGGGLWI